MRLGKSSKDATDIEMMEQDFAWKTDYQTGPNNETYSTVTAHFITEQCSLESII